MAESPENGVQKVVFLTEVDFRLCSTRTKIFVDRLELAKSWLESPLRQRCSPLPNARTASPGIRSFPLAKVCLTSHCYDNRTSETFLTFVAMAHTCPPKMQMS